MRLKSHVLKGEHTRYTFLFFLNGTTIFLEFFSNFSYLRSNRCFVPKMLVVVLKIPTHSCRILADVQNNVGVIPLINLMLLMKVDKKNVLVSVI